VAGYGEVVDPLGSVLPAVLIFVAIGAVFIAIGVGMRWQSHRFAHSAARAQGEVIDLVQRWGRYATDTLQSSRLHPVVRYRTASGQVVQFESALGTQPSLWRRGQTVTVLYDPAHPERAEIDTRARGVLQLAFIGLGGCLVVASLLLVVLFGLVLGFGSGSR
jgi:hypothetical protein